jgi:hypothetical protein
MIRRGRKTVVGDGRSQPPVVLEIILLNPADPSLPPSRGGKIAKPKPIDPVEAERLKVTRQIRSLFDPKSTPGKPARATWFCRYCGGPMPSFSSVCSCQKAATANGTDDAKPAWRDLPYNKARRLARERGLDRRRRKRPIDGGISS